MEKTVRFLAGEDLSGRGLGTAGIDEAARYVARRFEEFGLKPGGEGGWLQTWTHRDGATGEETTLHNVIAVIPGSRPEWSGQRVVIGAHYDHLGRGWPDVHSGDEGRIHPGADDNASGSAAILMLAERLSADYAALAPETPARSILFMCFSAEESGLNGSRHYTEHPLVPIEQHVLMINFDMIGRVRGQRLSVSGAGTGAGMDEWLAPFFEASPLTIVQPENMSGASDHTPFFRAGMPVLFAIIADFHDDYHTPRDVAWKINRVDAVHTVYLFHEVVLAAALHSEPFRFVEAPQGSRRAAPPRGPEIKVRVGVRPEPAAVGQGAGVRLASVAPGGPAAKAGLEAGDVIVALDGEPVSDANQFMLAISQRDPGSQVDLVVSRRLETFQTYATLIQQPPM